MRRLGRWTLNALTVVSLLLCVGACGLWVRSHYVTDRVSWVTAGGRHSVRTAVGAIEIGLTLFDMSGAPQWFHGPVYERGIAQPSFRWLLLLGGSAGDQVYDWEHAGVGWHERRNARLGTRYAMGFVPMWSLAAATGALPLAVVARRLLARLRKRREIAHRCAQCSYDLTGNVSGVCPECGKKIAEAVRHPPNLSE